jgi:Arylsulfotransferase (ASST)
VCKKAEHLRVQAGLGWKTTMANFTRVFTCLVGVAMASSASLYAAPVFERSDTLAMQDGPRGSVAQEGRHRAKGVTVQKESAFTGYTLMSPLQDTTTYLLDMNGHPVHIWKSDMRPGNSVYLQPNGHLFRAARPKNNDIFHGGGEGGRIREYDWQGKQLWQLDWNDQSKLHHHDFEILPNGNVLLIAWEIKTHAEALAAGRDPDLLKEGDFWPDYLVEIKPTRPVGGKVVWQWHVWDHLVQDQFPDLPNYGNPAEFPGRAYINGDRATEALSAKERAQMAALGYMDAEPKGKAEAGNGAPNGGKAGLGDESPKDGPAKKNPPAKRGGEDWMHTNGIDYNPELDQIVISVRRFNEFWVIDHSTTTAEAASESGGRSGLGGSILYRWGNPRSYGRGDHDDQQLFGQHDAQWIEADLPGGGNFLVFNNSSAGKKKKFSSVLEIAAEQYDDREDAFDDDGRYKPARPSWSYSHPEDFYSSFISGTQRLPNGNTLICQGAQGRVFEVTESGEIVWEYWNPYGESDPPEKAGPGNGPPDRAELGPRRGPGGARGPGGQGPEGRGPGGARGPGGRGPGGPGAAGPGKAPGGGGIQPIALFRATRIAADYAGLRLLKLEQIKVELPED